MFPRGIAVCWKWKAGSSGDGFNRDGSCGSFFLNILGHHLDEVLGPSLEQTRSRS